MTRLVPVAAAALIVGATSPASAAVSVRLSVSAPQAEVGEGIRVQLSAMSDDDSPGSPRLQAPSGFSVQGPSVASSTSFSLSNGHFEHQRGITATWIVVGTRPGNYVIGPAVVQVAGKTVRSQTATVQIVAPGTMPKRAAPQNPFDLLDQFDPFFSQMPKIPGMPNMGDLDDQLPGMAPESPPEYSVEHAAQPMAFLRATASPRNVVVGQQVTLRVYAYGGNGPYDEVGVSEPSRPDFLSQIIIDSSYRQPRYLMNIDGSRWTAVKIREIALFPLHAGDLTIGPMTMGFRGPAYPETSPMHGLVRSTKEIHIAVQEPPVAGRPPGYELGDVGSYTLSSEVEPRTVVAGDAVAVTVRLEGTGDVPHTVKVPEQKGVDWLEPTTTDSLTVHDGSVGGSRTFRYVVRLDQPGTHDLGAVTLPYYDAGAREYKVARTELGSVDVKPGKAAPASPSSSPSTGAPKPDGTLDELGPPRKTLGAPAVTPRHFTDTKGFFGLLAGGPLAVVALGGLAELVGRLRKRLSMRGRSLSAASRRSIADARAAAARGDKSVVAGAVERALYTAIEDRLGLRARAVLRQSLREKLEKAGAEPSLSAEVVDVLDACDKLRFVDGEAANTAGIIDRAASAIGRMPRAARANATEQAA